MNERSFRISIVLVALAFSVYFAWVVVPPLIENPDIVAGFSAGFANPFSSGFSADTIACWFVLAAWILFEARTAQIKHGWACLLLGLVPGVAVGFAAYLLLRHRQLRSVTPRATTPISA
jgi:hypothetical protein